MLKVVTQGSVALDQYGEKARILGVNLETGSAGAAKFQRSIADVSVGLLGFVDKMAATLGGEGAVAGLMDSFTLGLTFAGTFIATTIENIKVGITGFIQNLTAIPRAIKAAFSGGDPLAALTKGFTSTIDGLKDPLEDALVVTQKLAEARKRLADMDGAGTQGGQTAPG